MKFIKKFFILPLISLLFFLPAILVSCSEITLNDLKSMPLKKDNGVTIALQNGIFHITNEEDYQQAKADCKHRIMNRHNGSDYCLNQLRWLRNYGDLSFLGKEPLKPVYQD